MVQPAVPSLSGAPPFSNRFRQRQFPTCRCRAASYCCESHRSADRSEHRFSGECQLLQSEAARCRVLPPLLALHFRGSESDHATGLRIITKIAAQ